MAKLNINMASREQLMETAGVRAEIADEILKLRKKSGRIASLDELKDIHGVGPAALEQMRGVLDFSQKAAHQAAEQGAEVARSTARAGETAARTGEEVARSTAEETTRKAVGATADVTSIGARAALHAVKQTADTAAAVERAATTKAVEGSKGTSRSVLQLMGEQAQENMMLAMAVMQVRDVRELARIQGEYVQNSIGRMSRFYGAYTDLFGGVMQTAMRSAQQQTARRVG